MKIFAGAGLFSLAIGVLIIWTWIQGLIMCFHASIVVGIVGLFLQAPFCLETIVYWCSGYDMALHIARALGLP
jgi:hypothetical protein